MAAQNSSQPPYEACLIANLPSDVQHQILNIGNYVIRPLSFILAFLSFVFNMLVIIAVARTRSLQYPAMILNIGNYVFRPLSFILAFLSLLCNTLVIVAVTRTRSLQHPAMVMMCSLALTDVIFSLYSLYRYIEIFTHEHMCPNSHLLHSAISALCAQATLGNLAVISRDRHVATRSPLWYRNHVTKSRAFKIVCIPWLNSVLIAVVLYFSKNFEGVGKSLAQTLIPVPFALYVIVIIYFIIIMFHYLRIYFRKTVEVGNPNDALLKREKRLTNTVAGILLILVLTYFPALLVPFVLSAKGLYKNSLPFRPFYVVFIQLNGVLNPLLNLGRSRNMRKAIRDLFKCSSHKNSRHQLVIEAQNSSQHPYEACLIADLSSDVQHQILNIGNYVFRPLSFILAFLTFVFNTLVIIAVARTKSL
ncbi:unnamed protein product [Porites lobata]|uniref:G-protein coupled receptors family 1 profile domain-containing protein n=1 Tax=Porites lobata TaxID=104759 RepID=A0ABN8NZX1_9CNID|nr:unnamed protein product [Porites lobata]